MLVTYTRMQRILCDFERLIVNCHAPYLCATFKTALFYLGFALFVTCFTCVFNLVKPFPSPQQPFPSPHLIP